MEKVKSDGGKTAGCLLQPPTPIIRSSNWPTLEVQKTTLEDLSAAEVTQNGEKDYEVVAPTAAAADATADWEDVAFDEPDAAGPGADHDVHDDDDLGWGDELDDLGDLGDQSESAKHAPVDEMAGLQDVSDDTTFQMPVAGRPPAGCWVANSSHAADHVAAGGAASAMQLLNRQIAVCEFSVIKQEMIGCYLGSMMSVPGKFFS